MKESMKSSRQNINSRSSQTLPKLPAACTYLLKMLDEIKVYHWKTNSYARHKTSDKLYSKLQPSVDKFVEMYLITMTLNDSSLQPQTKPSAYQTKLSDFNIDMLSDEDYPEMLQKSIQILSTGFVGESVKNDIALSARRDAIVEELRTALYLSKMA